MRYKLARITISTCEKTASSTPGDLLNFTLSLACASAVAFRISAMLPASGPVNYCRCFLIILLISRLALPQTTVVSQQSRRAADSISQSSGTAASPPLASFKDIAEKAGVNFEIVSGEKDTKKYIIETTGPGVATFDYDNDGWPDIFLVNGTKLEGFPEGKGPTNRLYRNNHDGTFTDVTAKAGLTLTGWGQGVCVGDYDNDGWEDLYITYYGKNRLYHNRNGVFEEVAEKSGVAGSGKSWSTGCAFVDYNRDGSLDLIVANYVDFDQPTAAKPGERSS